MHTPHNRVFHLSPPWCQILSSHLIFLYICFFSPSFSAVLDPFLLLHGVMESWRFVYQNIDLFFFVHFHTFFKLLVHFWSSRWQQQGQERDRAVCIWGVLCLIGSVSLCIKDKGIFIWLVPLKKRNYWAVFVVGGIIFTSISFRHLASVFLLLLTAWV